MSELPLGWTRARLDDVADVLDFEREPINSSERSERIAGKKVSELFAYYGATGKVGSIDDFRSEGQRVLLGEDGAPFLDSFKDKAYLVNGRFWVNNHAHVLRGAVGFVDNRFLCHQLNTVDYQPFVSGSTRLKLTSAAMRQIPLLVAPLEEQARIVEKLEELLSDLDAAVAELKAAQKKLAQYRQSLLKAAVEGALTAKWRAERAQRDETTESGAQHLARILIERRKRWEVKQLTKYKEQGKTPLKDWRDKYSEPVTPIISELPSLPKNWVWTTMESLIDEGPQNGLYLPSDRYGRGCPILRIDDFQIGWVRERGNLNLVDADLDTVESYELIRNDLVVNRVNSMTHLGKSLVVNGALCGALFESNMMRIRLSQLANVKYVGLYLGSEIGRKRLIRDAKWAVNQASINQQDVKRTLIPFPPIEEQLLIGEIVADQLLAVERQVRAIEIGVKQSTAQRKNILKAAFSGQLVRQDPNDEPASVLLERIRAERSDRVLTGKKRGSTKLKDPA